MYKSAVILVALIGTACAFPPADILRKSVAEDNVDEKAPEIPSQGSEVENQREDDGVRESDKKSTSEYRLFTATMKIPEFTTVTAIRSDQSAEESKVPKKLCDKTATDCDFLGESARREKRNTEMLPLGQNIPIDQLKIINLSDIDNFLEGTTTLNDGSNKGKIQVTNVPQVDITSDGQIVISLEKVNVPIDILEDLIPSQQMGARDSTVEELKKVQREYQVMKKKLEKAEKDLAEKIKKSNREKKLVEVDWQNTLQKNRVKEEQERKTLQKKHDAAVKELTEELDDLKEKLEQQSKNFTETVREVKTGCEKTLKDNQGREERQRETQQEAHNTEVKILKEKLVDLREELDQRSRNLTTTVEEGKKICEKTLKDNQGREERERETLQKAHDTEVKILEEKLVDLREELDQRSRNFPTTEEEGKKICEKTLKENKEREDRERETLQTEHAAEIESLKEKLMKEKQVSIGLEEKMITQTTECVQNLKAQKERWDNRLTEQTEQSKKELAKITELYETCVADKEKKDKQMKELQSFGR
ncbi:DNA ligase 1-like isoform X2 [Neodiprion virginianus]|uniref:DNA ligase 1-like isoform X2 n=1 Tax=Neodiprion virginianus TaxID=2961670 RepID=UPI001EE69D08|nr:DNA ligase 1-like isoform X2 [Neodiprion virginianus]